MDFYKAIGLDAEHPRAEQMVLAPKSDRLPVVRALLGYSDPEIIAEKLIRLERYCATTTRLRIRESRFHSLLMEWENKSHLDRVSIHLSILRGLMLADGCKEVKVTPAGGREGGVRIDWATSRSSSLLDGSDEPELNKHLEAIIARDPSRAWRIEGAAAELGMSGRSLQRYLLSENSSFSAVLREARTRMACDYLRNSELNLGEIGFCCGYADQAHFQREFRRVMDTTPRHYRKRAELRTAS